MCIVHKVDGRHGAMEKGYAGLLDLIILAFFKSGNIMIVTLAERHAAHERCIIYLHKAFFLQVIPPF